MWPGPLPGVIPGSTGVVRPHALSAARESRFGSRAVSSSDLPVSGCGAPPRPSTTSISMRDGDGRAISSRKGRSIKAVSGFFGYAQNDSGATPGLIVMLRPVRQGDHARCDSAATPGATVRLRPVRQGDHARSGRAATPGPAGRPRPVAPYPPGTRAKRRRRWRRGSSCRRIPGTARPPPSSLPRRRSWRRSAPDSASARRTVPCEKLFHSNTPIGPFHSTVQAAFDGTREGVGGSRPDVHDAPSGGYLARADHSALGVLVELIGNHHVFRQ